MNFHCKHEESTLQWVCHFDHPCCINRSSFCLCVSHPNGEKVQKCIFPIMEYGMIYFRQTFHFILRAIRKHYFNIPPHSHSMLLYFILALFLLDTALFLISPPLLDVALFLKPTLFECI